MKFLKDFTLKEVHNILGSTLGIYLFDIALTMYLWLYALGRKEVVQLTHLEDEIEEWMTSHLPSGEDLLSYTPQQQQQQV